MALAPVATWTGHGIIPVNGIGDRLPFSLPANVNYPQGLIVGEKVGVNQVDTLTIGSQSTSNYTLTVGGYTTGNIDEAASAATVQTALRGLASLAGPAVHIWTLNNTPTGGTWTASYGGQTTIPLAYNAAAAVVQAALEALSSIGTGNMTVSGSAGGPYTLTAAGTLIDQPFPSGCFAFYYALLTGAGSPPTVTDAVVSPGGSGVANVTVAGSNGGPFTVTFQNAWGKQAVVMTGDFSALTTPGNASIATATAGSAGTPGQVTAYASTNTDGSQIPVGVLEYPCSTDAAGKIFLGGSTAPYGYEPGQFSTPVFVGGCNFRCSDLSGLDAAALTNKPSWTLVNGNVNSGTLRLP